MRAVGRLVWIVALAVVGLSASAAPRDQARTIHQTPPPPAQAPGTPPQTPATAPADYTFPSGTGMLLFYVKPDKTADFEAVVARISEVLGKTQDPGRKQQALNWKIYKSTETPKESALYLFYFDPAVVTADYDPIKLLSEGLPAEVQGLYDKLKEAIVRVERMGLSKLR